MKATGLGCFVDDDALKYFGISPNEYKVLYHFTIGYSKDPYRYPSYSYEDEVFNIVNDDETNSL